MKKIALLTVLMLLGMSMFACQKPSKTEEAEQSTPTEPEKAGPNAVAPSAATAAGTTASDQTATGMPAASATETSTKEATSATIPTKAPIADTLGFEYPVLPKKMKVGESISLDLTGVDPAPYEFRWQEKFGAKWIPTPWSTNPSYSFAPTKPGLYSIQVDIRKAGTPKSIGGKWLGMIKVTE